MATIKDVAKLAGVSVTTVSIIINGKAAERKISEQTQQRVAEAMRELGYQPNLSARRLRSQDSLRPAIAFFWPLDYRVSILASFLNAMQLEMKALNFDCELVIQPYENDCLDQYDSAILRTGYNGVIIGACSQKDMAYLESISPQIPILLINRSSEQFSTIRVNNEEIGLMAARQIRMKGYTEAAVIAAQNSSYMATGLRMDAFLHSCKTLGIQVAPEHILKGPSTMEGGYQCARSWLTLVNAPKILFFDTDVMAIGALRAFHQAGVAIPGDLEILSIAVFDAESTAYSIPSLSVISLPNQTIGRRAIALMRDKISRNDLTPAHIEVPVSMQLRESFQNS